MVGTRTRNGIMEEQADSNKIECSHLSSLRVFYWLIVFFIVCGIFIFSLFWSLYNLRRHMGCMWWLLEEKRTKIKLKHLDFS